MLDERHEARFGAFRRMTKSALYLAAARPECSQFTSPLYALGNARTPSLSRKQIN